MRFNLLGVAEEKMGLDASVKIVIGFPIKVLDIVDEVDLPSCGHAERLGGVFCSVCGVRVGVRRGLVLRDPARTKPIQWRDVEDVAKIEGVGLVSRATSGEDSPVEDDLYLCGVVLGEAQVVRRVKSIVVSLKELSDALVRVQRAHAALPHAQEPALHLLPYASY